MAAVADSLPKPVQDHQTDTYRVVYTVRFADAVYVLHAFQKKSKRGIATPKHEVDLIRRRYDAARTHYQNATQS